MARTLFEIALAFVVIAIALGLFAFGLISPLTPSEGMPSWFELFVFWILPWAMLFLNSRRSPLRWLRIVLRGAASVVFVLYVFLLAVMF